MTAHTDHTDHTVGRTGRRPRWVLPALLLAVAAGVLLYLGVITPSSLLSIGLFGGMIGMHLFGHGMHGGHAGSSPDARETESGMAQDPTAATSPDDQRRGGCH